MTDESEPIAARVRPLILVADDEEDILTLVVFRLEREGYEVITASDGMQALAVIRERLPDLAILDVMMPKLTGHEITARLRAAESTRDIRVILLTARVEDADVARGLEAGADDYVTKPFSPHALHLRVQALLNHR